MIAASLVLLALLGGLAAVVAVQTVANARLAASLTGETNANTALNEANAELTQSRAAVQARYDLAIEAIKTFHTGVSEDFLLKEEKFKDLRDRLLKSASDFYGKLGALLGKETDLASRRALAAGELRAGRADGQGRPQGGRAGGAPGGAGGAGGAGGRAGGRRRAKVDVGRSLTAVAWLLNATGKTDEALATYRRSESLLADPAGIRPGGAGRAGGLPVAAGLRPGHRRQDRRRPGGLPAGSGRPGGAGRRPRGRRTRPGATWRTRSFASASCCRETGKPSEAEAEFRRALAIYAEAGRRQPRRHRIPQRPGGQPRRLRRRARG